MGISQEFLAGREFMGKHLGAGRLKEAIHLSGEKERTAVEDRCTQCLFGELTEINHQDQTANIQLGRFNTWDCDSET